MYVPDLGGPWIRHSDYEQALQAERERGQAAAKFAEKRYEELADDRDRLGEAADRAFSELKAVEAQRDCANEALEEAERRAANWKRRAESADRGRET